MFFGFWGFVLTNYRDSERGEFVSGVFMVSDLFLWGYGGVFTVKKLGSYQ